MLSKSAGLHPPDFFEGWIISFFDNFNSKINPNFEKNNVYPLSSVPQLLLYLDQWVEQLLILPLSAKRTILYS